MRPPLTQVKWEKTYRLINSVYPTCDIWEDIISKAEDWEIAFEIEAMSNDRVRQEVGDISLIPKERMVTGPNSWWVIAPFTKINPSGARFSNGRYGAYYAASNFPTALKEKSFGLTREFMEATNEEIIDITCRVLLGKIDSRLHDIRGKNWEKYHHHSDYTHSQKLGHELREEGSNGIVYNSVRNKTGQCFAAFWPDVVAIPIQERHVILHWDGTKISNYCVIGKDKERIAI